MRDDFVPTTYEDLYLHYFADRAGWAAGVVRRYFKGAAESGDLDDLLHDSWMRCRRQELLEKYDPTRGNFGGLIFQAVRSECLNRLGRDERTPTEGAAGLHEIRGAMEPTQEEDAQAASVLRLLEAVAEEAAEGADPGSRDAKLGQMVAMLLDEATGPEVADALGISKASVCYWRRDLRAKAGL